MSFGGQSPSAKRVRYTPQSADPVNPAEGDVFYADGTSRGEGLWIYKNGAWEQVGVAGASLINYITNADAASGTAGYVTYSNTAQSSPVTGSGGSPNITFTVTTNASEILRGTASFNLSKDAANRQGQGVSYDFTLDREDYEASKMLQVAFDYRTSTDYASNDISVWVYDRDNAIMYPVQRAAQNANGITASTTATRFTGYFYSVANANDYRLIWHIGSTNASAYTVQLDNVSVSPQVTVPGAIVTPWEPFTPTGTWTTNTTYAGRQRRVGDTLQMQVEVSLSGAPNAATNLYINLPSGLTIDTTKLVNATSGEQSNLGRLAIRNAAGVDWFGILRYESTTQVRAIYLDASANQQAVATTAPFSFANNDKIEAWIEVPISGWSSGASLSTTESMFSTARARAFRNTSTQSIPTGTVTPTKIQFNGESYDPQSLFDSTTNYDFTAPRAGYYQVNSAVNIAASSTGTRNIFIFVNNDEYSRTRVDAPASGNNAVMQISDIVFANAGEKIDIRVTQDSGGSLNVTNGSNTTWVSIQELPDFSVFSVYGETTKVEASSAGLVSYAITAGNWGDLTSFTLQPGEWDIQAQAVYNSNGATTTTSIAIGVSTTSGNSSTGLVDGDSSMFSTKRTASGDSDPISLYMMGVTVTAPTVYYFKARAATSINFLRIAWKISARRVK